MTQQHGNACNNPADNTISGSGQMTVQGLNWGRDWANLGANLSSTWNIVIVFGEYNCFVNGQTVIHNGNVGLERSW